MTVKPAREWSGFGPLPADAATPPPPVYGAWNEKIIVAAWPRKKRQRRLRRSWIVRLSTHPSGSWHATRETIDYRTQRERTGPGSAAMSYLPTRDVAEFLEWLGSIRHEDGGYVFSVRLNRISPPNVESPACDVCGMHRADFALGRFADIAPERTDREANEPFVVCEDCNRRHPAQAVA